MQKFAPPQHVFNALLYYLALKKKVKKKKEKKQKTNTNTNVGVTDIINAAQMSRNPLKAVRQRMSVRAV